MARQKTDIKSRKKSRKSYVLFGFKKDDIDTVGYFGDNLDIVSSKYEAKQFYTKPSDLSSKIALSNFGTPEQWRDFINSDDELNHGYKFHLI